MESRHDHQFNVVYPFSVDSDPDNYLLKLWNTIPEAVKQGKPHTLVDAITNCTLEQISRRELQAHTEKIEVITTSAKWGQGTDVRTYLAHSVRGGLVSNEIIGMLVLFNGPIRHVGIFISALGDFHISDGFSVKQVTRQMKKDINNSIATYKETRRRHINALNLTSVEQ